MAVRSSGGATYCTTYCTSYGTPYGTTYCTTYCTPYGTTYCTHLPAKKARLRTKGRSFWSSWRCTCPSAVAHCW